MDIGEVISQVRFEARRRTCRLIDFPEAFDDVLRCTAPWNACGVDSIPSFPSKGVRRSETSISALKGMVERTLRDWWDEEDSWLLE